MDSPESEDGRHPDGDDARPAWIVAGLGNPGERYAGTRHDVGFALLHHLAREARLDWARAGDCELAGPVTWGRGQALLARPQLYMNVSGPPLRRLLEATGLPVEALLVVTDDVNLELGRLRLRRRGSSGGHNGLESIIGELGPEFPRLRLGVGGAPSGMELSDWVLGPFTEEERTGLEDMKERAAWTVRHVVGEGLEAVLPRVPTQPREDETNTSRREDGEGNGEDRDD